VHLVGCGSVAPLLLLMHTRTCTRLHTHTHARIHTRTHACTHSHTTHTNTHTCTAALPLAPASCLGSPITATSGPDGRAVARWAPTACRWEMGGAEEAIRPATVWHSPTTPAAASVCPTGQAATAEAPALFKCSLQRVGCWPSLQRQHACRQCALQVTQQC